MIVASIDARTKINNHCEVLFKSLLTLADGTQYNITGEDVMGGSVEFTQSVSSNGSFDIGSAIIGSHKLKLYNFDRRFDSFDFTGAHLTSQVGIPLDNGNVEWIRKGTYWVEQPKSYGEIIQLNCDDSLCKFDVPYSEVNTKFPATAAVIARDICTHCGVPIAYINFANSGIVFRTAPDKEISCREALSYLAQATGNFVRITNDDRVEITWYNTSIFDDEDWLDGEEFDAGNPYQSGSDADGGNFTDYSSGDNYDGGSFENGQIANIYSYSQATVITDDVVITGVQVTAQDEETEDGKGKDGETYLQGAKGYVLVIKDNPFITYGRAREFAQIIGAHIVGMTFRPFTASVIGDPLVEASDGAIITDRNQNSHCSYLTTVTYKIGQFATYACNAETTIRNASTSTSITNKVIQSINNAIKQEKTARQAALERLQEDLETSAGMYYSSKRESDGSTTWLVHDKPTLADSKIVWKVNAGGFGMSIDGGKTYSYGLDKWGNAILQSVYAVGIDADYITAGSLRVRSGNKTVFCADVKAGQFWWDATYSALTNTGELTVRKGNIGGFTINSSSITNQVITLTSRGMELKQTGTLIGYIGTNAVHNHPNLKGLDFNMEPGGAYMGWSYRNSTSKLTYDFKLCYVANSFDTFTTSDRIYLGCDLDANNYRLRHAWIDPNTGGCSGGINGTISFVKVTSVGSDGRLGGWNPGCHMTFKNGMLVSATW